MRERLGDGLWITATDHHGWWIWSDLLQMNIAMKANSREDAMFDGLQAMQQAILWERERANKYQDFHKAIMAVLERGEDDRTVPIIAAD